MYHGTLIYKNMYNPLYFILLYVDYVDLKYEKVLVIK